MSTAPSRAGSLPRWLALQFATFFGLVAQMVLVGAVMSIVRRQFSWLGFLACLLVMHFGIGAAGLGFVWAEHNAQDLADVILWVGVLGTMFVSGLVAARVGRRVGFWEIYLATLVCAALVVVQLWRGWNHVLHIGPTDVESYVEFLTPMSPGTRYLGTMWDRIVALGAIGGFLVAVMGGSVGFLIWADGGQRDPGLGLEWWVARRHLSGRQVGPVSVTAVVAVLGIGLGVASLVAVTAVMSGYQEDIQRKILSTNAHLVVQKYGVDFTEYDAIIKEALRVPGVLAGSPFSFNEAMVSAGDVGLGVLVKGINPDSAVRVTDIGRNLCDPAVGVQADGAPAAPDFSQHAACERFADGDAKLHDLLDTQDGVPSVVVGAELYRRLKQPIGSRVTLTTPVGIAGARGNAPKRMEFRLAGTFRSGMHEFDSRLVYLALKPSQELMGLGRAVNGVELRVADPERVEGLAKQVMSAVGHYPYRTLDWRELNAGIFTALKLQKIVMFLVLTFIVVVAAFNIASTLFMAVVEKARDVAVLKSMGARDASIMKIFVIEGWLTGSMGTLFGVALGLGVAWLLGKMRIGIAADVYMVDALTVRVQPVEVAVTVLAALSISHLATLYPALKAARQRPVDAMRYE